MENTVLWFVDKEAARFTFIMRLQQRDLVVFSRERDGGVERLGEVEPAFADVADIDGPILRLAVLEEGHGLGAVVNLHSNHIALTVLSQMVVGTATTGNTHNSENTNDEA